ncbi:aldehyde dehydrogenase family protein [Alphaproteobacteria bacterium]|nr:aldehyde dehydrogenase family protein [Alphaproteobacteria bacterium]
MTQTIKCISPIDGSLYAERVCLDLDAAMAACEKAKSASAGWAATPLDERIAYVKKANDYIANTKARMVEELAHQMGRPVRYGGEYGGFDERLTHMADIAEACLRPDVIEDSPTARRLIKREPHGIVLVIAPWNYPYMTAINTIAPALIAGNTVILKHASQTILVGEHLGDAFRAAGLPDGVFQNLVLDHGTTSTLIAARKVDFVNFTGSVAGGKAMEVAAAGTFLPISTELGGKDPGYVREDADIEAAIDGLIDGAMFNSGQCCCGIERIYVDEKIYPEFLEKAIALVKTSKLGNPLDPETTIGPMANIRFANEVREQINDAIAAGATAHIPRFDGDDDGAYLGPQILSGVSHDMRIMRDESFGPVVGIMPVRGDDEAITLMNDCAYGLTASIWTKDAAAAEAIGDQLETGTVFLNRCDYLDPALCWTGCKDTGRGTGLSTLGYQALTRPKSYHLKR